MPLKRRGGMLNARQGYAEVELELHAGRIVCAHRRPFNRDTAPGRDGFALGVPNGRELFAKSLRTVRRFRGAGALRRAGAQKVLIAGKTCAGREAVQSLAFQIGDLDLVAVQVHRPGDAQLGDLAGTQEHRVQFMRDTQAQHLRAFRIRRRHADEKRRVVQGGEEIGRSKLLPQQSLKLRQYRAADLFPAGAGFGLDRIAADQVDTAASHEGGGGQDFQFGQERIGQRQTLGADRQLPSVGRTRRSHTRRG